jgi:unsaturated rhamnogalacturonyl hydrolase
MYVVCAVALLLSGCAAAPPAGNVTGITGVTRFTEITEITEVTEAQVTAIIDRVNGYWQGRERPQKWAFWDVAAYHTGNMAAYRVTGNPAYRRYSEAWAEHNGWQGARSTDKAAWQYQYGETDQHVLFGDWQVCFQTYADLYQLEPDPRRIARAREVMEYQMSTPRVDYWWWSDGLYMVMPVMTKLYRATGNKQYLEKLYQYFQYANSIMYDDAAGLYYRDARYVYPAHRSANGGKDFWSRGDGWVFAGLARVLDELPADDPHRADYVAKFQSMALALKAAQSADGYWPRSLLDPGQAPGPETSGTAFFVYGYLWGINHGVLARDEYLPVARKGWRYLSTTALQPDGKVGYVQPIGDRAIAGQVVDRDSTAGFGVGAYLLAAAELVRLLRQQ